MRAEIAIWTPTIALAIWDHEPRDFDLKASSNLDMGATGRLDEGASVVCASLYEFELCGDKHRSGNATVAMLRNALPTCRKYALVK
jgi:hypothetical protein